jgi:hypothetical protein
MSTLEGKINKASCKAPLENRSYYGGAYFVGKNKKFSEANNQAKIKADQGTNNG